MPMYKTSAVFEIARGLSVSWGSTSVSPAARSQPRLHGMRARKYKSYSSN